MVTGVNSKINVEVNGMQRHILELRRLVSPDVGDGERGSSDSRCETGIEFANDDKTVFDNVKLPKNPDLKFLRRKNPARVRQLPA